ncbi:MAG: DUF3881 family protein [Defluviitaleaceae bacterium]|nr:DUF3881 family protein [Defluviitaleaceae bacterium]
MFQINKSNDSPIKLKSIYKALGLAEIADDKRKINKILRQASFSPDFMFECAEDKKGRIFFDRYKYLGDGFGINVIGYRKMRTDKEGKRVEKHVVMEWDIFAQSTEDNFVTNTFIDIDYLQMGYCFADDAASGNAFEFRINNMLQLYDEYKKLPTFEHVMDFEAGILSVNMAMLIMYGTVLLPVDKSDTEEWINPEEDLRKDLLSRAKDGDANAEYILHQMAIEQESELSERLANEDLLSIFEGYFLNLVEQSGIFSILADILSVEELTNEVSGEKIFRITTSITDTKIAVYINDKDLIGVPSAGMRLMGFGLLQGSVKI